MGHLQYLFCVFLDNGSIKELTELQELSDPSIAELFFVLLDALGTLFQTGTVNDASLTSFMSFWSVIFFLSFKNAIDTVFLAVAFGESGR